MDKSMKNIEDLYNHIKRVLAELETKIKSNKATAEEIVSYAKYIELNKIFSGMYARMQEKVALELQA